MGSTSSNDSTSFSPSFAPDESKKTAGSKKQGSTTDNVQALLASTANLEQKMSDLEVKLRDLQSEVNETKLKTIETLGVFVAVFTFISIDFQILRTVEHPLDVFALLFLSAGLLMLFPLLINYVVNDNKIWNYKFNRLFFISILLVFIGAFLMVTRVSIDPKFEPKVEHVYEINPGNININLRNTPIGSPNKN